MAQELFYEGHTNSVKQVLLTSTEREFMTCSNDFTIMIWDLPTYGLKKILKGHTDEVNSISLSYDDRVLVSSSKDKTIRVWDLNQNYDAIFLKDSYDIVCILLSKDMRYIASSFSNGELRLWTYYNKEVILSLHTFFHEIYKFTFTPDNDHIILGSNSTDIKVWNISENHIKYLI
ncbi:hypothetical protein SteCoe_17599 [Stentor coeruleus]|uniref:Uncharacterized protein n=1 Tax=Stentor coeruleus TaxID=5963 RepID=A0A1R2BYG8_9CILI|nr:hypothetical protein SteCoe_17599 [Stentor coeruleus]